MRARQKVSRAGVELIKSFEGLRTLAARLPDGRWTLGYGHTFSAREGARVTQEDADALLRFDLLPVVDAINNLVLVPLNQNQFDSLVSFAFNIGTENFAASSVLKRINEGRMSEAALAMDSWRSAEFNGQTYVLAPLIRRRAAEKDLFLTPEDISHQAAALGRPVEDALVEAPIAPPVEMPVAPPAAPDPALYHNPYATPAAPVASPTQRQIIDLGSPYSAPVEKPAEKSSEKPTIVRMADVSPYAPEAPVEPAMSAEIQAAIARAQEEQRQREEAARAAQAAQVQAQAQAQAQAMAQAVAAARAVEEARQREETRLREEALILDAQRMEAARAEQARQEAARREQARLDQWRAAEARIEQARLEQEQFEAARQELARQEAARQELERAEWAREQARLEQARLDQARLEQVRLEQARQQELKWEQERLERVRIEQELAEQARIEAARLEAARLEQERVERERLERAHAEQAQLEQERIARERTDQVRLEQERREQEERDRQTSAEAPEPIVADEAERARKAEAAAALMRLYSPYGGGNLGRPLTPNLFPAKPASQPDTVTSTPVSTPAPEPVEPAPEFTQHSVISPSQVESAPFEVASRAEDLTPETDLRPVFAPVPSAATMPPPVITALNPYAKPVATPDTASETVVEVPRPAPVNLSAPSNAPIAAEVGGLNWRDQLQRPLPQDYQAPASQVAAEPEQPFLRAGPSSNFQTTETYEDDDHAWMMNGDRIALSSEEHQGEEKTWWQMIAETMWLIIFSGVGLGCLGFATGAWWQATHDQVVVRAGLVDTYTTVSIIMAAAGILFVSISVWLILKRLGGLKD
ncbi:hypothetical protein MMA231_02765 [Asticcacaulis sp. MM231]|uniref:glycoside hydrolase family protein n=1 Tax=Asticcacaulis sp. MM231 TaxID=3157666 RepID=UPI0032D57A6A